MLNTLINFYKNPITVTQNEVLEELCLKCRGEQESDKWVIMISKIVNADLKD